MGDRPTQADATLLVRTPRGAAYFGGQHLFDEGSAQDIGPLGGIYIAFRRRWLCAQTSPVSLGLTASRGRQGLYWGMYWVVLIPTTSVISNRGQRVCETAVNKSVG